MARRSRRFPDLSVVNKSWAEQAEDFILYYDITAEDNGSSWLLGLFMAKQWLRLLKAPQPNLEEAGLMLMVLEAERANQGTGWSDMLFRVRRWVAEIE